MNKLVIVGNGFDLAHGLPTSYKDFIDDFWLNLKENYATSQYQDIVDINPSFPDFIINLKAENYEEFRNEVQKYIRFHKQEHGIQIYADSKKTTNLYSFQNSFFRNINSKNSIGNWVDIENEYYQELKKIAKHEEWDQSLKKKNVKILNKEFDQIKDLLKNYLIRNTNESYDFQARIPRFDYFTRLFEVRPKYIKETKDSENYLKEFSVDDHPEIIKFDDELIKADQVGQLSNFLSNEIKETIFLNFNYTNSLYGYVNTMNSRSYGTFYRTSEIPIHGNLNEMNFGFGDEMDADYNLIENLNDKEYLENFKSFKYSQNSNYKNMLDFIDSEKFQTYVIGHSCGLSDRTLLNTIFEHENCRSIKIFYHQWENDNGDKEDNFTEIVQNISRHFNDKKVMRSKIVNKTLCKPLPQDIRFQENQS